MSARLATANDTTRTIRDSGTIALGARRQPQEGTIEFDSGYLSPYFVTDPERMEVAFENAYILIHQQKINSRKDLLPLLEQIAKSGKPLLIIADDIGGEALAALVVHKLCGSLRVAAVRAPSFGDQSKNMLQDIALLTSTKTLGKTSTSNLRNIQISDLGQASKIIVAKNNTVVEGRSRDHQICFQV